MSNIGDLGNNNGHIIVQRPNDTTIVTTFSNSNSGVKQAINHALSAGTLSGNIAAHGSITIDDLTGMAAEDVTAININGNNQIGAPVNVGALTLVAFAAALRDAINAFSPGAGPDYTASSIGNVVTVNDLASNGSTNNGSAISLAKTNVLILTTETPIDGGSESDTPQDKSFGNKYILNSTPGSDADDFAGGEDITKSIVMRGMQSVIDTIILGVAAGETGIIIPRTMVMMNILLKAGAPETINTISTDDFSIGDQILLSNESTGSAVTINETGNIVLANSSDFVSGSSEIVLALKLTDVSSTLKWAEIYRSPNIEISVAAMRAVLIPQPESGTHVITMVAGGQTELLTPGTTPGYIRIEGFPNLTGAFVLNFPSGGLSGDRFILDYLAQPTLSGGSVMIWGTILSPSEIQDGSLRFEAYFHNASWNSTKIFDANNSGYITNSDIATDSVDEFTLSDGAVVEAKIAALAVTNAKIGALAVTPNKVSTAVKRGMISYPVSWEASGLGTNITTQIGGKGTVTKMIISVTLLVEATNDGTVTFFNTTSGSTIGVVTVLAGTTRGSVVVSTTFTDPTFDDGDVITVSTAKVTAGGEATVTLIYDGTE